MKLAVLVVEDEPEVRQALQVDLRELAKTIRLELAENAADASTVIDEIRADGDTLAVVLCDHRMPGMPGVDFLIELMGSEDTRGTKKVLVTGQADLSDTIRAINEAKLDHYIAKPWDGDGLRNVVRTLLTEYVVDEDVDAFPHMAVLDKAALEDALRQQNS